MKATHEDGGCSCRFRYHDDGRMEVLRTCTYHDAAVDEARLERDREWSNRLESQDTMHPDSPDLDLAIAWYAHGRLNVTRSEVKP